MEAVERKSRLTIHGTFSCFFHLGNVVLYFEATSL